MGLGNLICLERISYHNTVRLGDHTDIFDQMDFKRQSDKWVLTSSFKGMYGDRYTGAITQIVQIALAYDFRSRHETVICIEVFFTYVEVSRNVGCELVITLFRYVGSLLYRARRCRLQKQPKNVQTFCVLPAAVSTLHVTYSLKTDAAFSPEMLGVIQIMPVIIVQTTDKKESHLLIGIPYSQPLPYMPCK